MAVDLGPLSDDMGWIPPEPPLPPPSFFGRTMGVVINGECKRCHCTSRLELDLHLCSRCLSRLLYCRVEPPAYRMVPDVPTDEQAVEVFTFCAETILLHRRVERLTGVDAWTPSQHYLRSDLVIYDGGTCHVAQ